MKLGGCFWSLINFIQPQFIDKNRVAIYQCGHYMLGFKKNSGTRKGGVVAQFGLRQNRVVFVAQFQKIKNAAV
jgi:hypothetical protein